MPGPARLGRINEIRDLALQLMKAFSVKKGLSPAGPGFGVVLKPEPEHAAESEPVGGTGEFTTRMRCVAQRVEGEPP